MSPHSAAAAVPRSLARACRPLPRLSSRPTQTRLSSNLSLPRTVTYPAYRPPMPRMRQPKRHFTTTLRPLEDPKTTSPETPSTLYTFTDIANLSSSPSDHRILVDVREPAELQSTGHIPTAKNIPITSAGDAFFLGAEEFEDRFGFAKPTKDDEVIFYCKAGVRSKAAARIAQQAGFGGKIGEFPGSWVEWVENGGAIERS